MGCDNNFPWTYTQTRVREVGRVGRVGGWVGWVGCLRSLDLHT